MKLCEGVFVGGSWEDKVWGLALGFAVDAKPYTVVVYFRFHVGKGACSILKKRNESVSQERIQVE